MAIRPRLSLGGASINNLPSAQIPKEIFTTQNQNEQSNFQGSSDVLRELESRYRNINPGRPEVVDVLTSDILMKAPENFFDKYTRLVESLTLKIQNNLSQSDQAALIAQMKSDPTNEALKENTFYAINSEFVKIDSTTNDRDPEYISLSTTERNLILSLIVNEICGLGPLEPLFKDFSMRELICNGPYDIQVETKGTVKKVPACKFRNPQHLQDLITKLYTSVNKDITRTNPMERARLHDNSRIFAVHESVAPSGPSLNIRRHTDDWISPDQLLQFESMSPEVMEWIGAHIHQGLNFLVSGGTSTGKTTLLGALTGFYRNDVRILTVERNIELKGAPGKLWGTPMEVVPPKPGSISQGVTMRDLVEATTQQRPDGIIVGETTGPEAWDLVQALNTGHFGASTIHANSSEDAIYRLMSLIAQADLIKGQVIYDLISSAFDLIIQISRFPQDGSRKVVEICEVGTECVLGDNNVIYLPTKPIWQFVPNVESSRMGAKVSGHWVKVGELSEERKIKHNLNFSRLKTWPELQELYKEK